MEMCNLQQWRLIPCRTTQSWNPWLGEPTRGLRQGYLESKASQMAPGPMGWWE